MMAGIGWKFYANMLSCYHSTWDSQHSHLRTLYKYRQDWVTRCSRVWNLGLAKANPFFLGGGGDCSVVAQMPDTSGLRLCDICNLLLYQTDQTNSVASYLSFETNATRAAYIYDLPMFISPSAKHKPSPLPYRPDGMYPRLQVVYQCFVKIPPIRCDWMTNGESKLLLSTHI